MTLLALVPIYANVLVIPLTLPDHNDDQAQVGAIMLPG